MLHRSSDAYARRPTTEDRRGSESRDRRMDPYRDERYREPGASLRERRKPLESSRSTSSGNSATKPRLTVNSSRSEQGPRTGGSISFSFFSSLELDYASTFFFFFLNVSESKKMPPC